TRYILASLGLAPRRRSQLNSNVRLHMTDQAPTAASREHMPQNSPANLLIVVAACLSMAACSSVQRKAVNADELTPERRARNCAPLVYPENARFMGIYGTTEVLAEVNKEGRVSNAIVAKSSGNSNEHKALDRASLEQVKTCVFFVKPEFAFELRPIRVNWILVPGG
ncbi:MAG: TonB family protein, partial [Rubrivivax sp.]|nr:TonB family protein [Rubrivivax sp.]